MKGMNSRMVCYFSVLFVHLELVDLNEIAERLSAVKKADSSTLIRNQIQFVPPWSELITQQLVSRHQSISIRNNNGNS